MTCEEIRNWLGPCLDDEVAPDMRGVVADHLAGCRGCARELDSLRRVTSTLAQGEPTPAPPALWDAVQRRLAQSDAGRRWATFTLRRVTAVAAVLLMAVGLGLLALPWGWDGVRSAQAATVDFGVLLDGLKLDPEQAFDAFLAQYRPAEISPAEARAFAPDLTFELPDLLPGGFRRVAAYRLHIGDRRGIAARYERDGELLGFVFHPPILQMRFGERENRACFIGKVHGHAVDIGEWTLSHLTDATTCHCVLTRLDKTHALPEVMAAIAPGVETAVPPAGHEHP